MLDANNKELKRIISNGFAPLEASDSILYPWDANDISVMDKSLSVFRVGNELNGKDKLTQDEVFQIGFRFGVMWGEMMGRVIREA